MKSLILIGPSFPAYKNSAAKHEGKGGEEHRLRALRLRIYLDLCGEETIEPRNLHLYNFTEPRNDENPDFPRVCCSSVCSRSVYWLYYNFILL